MRMKRPHRSGAAHAKGTRSLTGLQFRLRRPGLRYGFEVAPSKPPPAPPLRMMGRPGAGSVGHA